jgi:tetratricopeptide (TPR) repeat protein
MLPSAPSRAVLLFALFSTMFGSTLAYGVAAKAPDGETLLQQEHYRQLYSLAQERLARNPNDADALIWLSAVYDASGDIDRAVEAARRAATAAPSSSEAHCQLADTLGDKAVKVGILHGAYPLARQMRRELDTSLELDPHNLRCLRESMGLYEEAPSLAGGSKSKASQTLQQIEQINPADGARAEAALLQMQKRPLPEIETSLRRAVALNPHFYRALIDLTSILASDSYRRWPEAEHFARQAIAADPDRAPGYVYLAEACARQQHWSELDAALEAAERHVPDDLAPLYSAALALLDSGTELPRAERYLRKYLTEQPEAGAPTLSTAHWKLGLVLEKEGRLADAARELRAAEAGNSNDPAFKKDFKRIAGGNA